MLDARYGMQDVRYGMLDVRYGMLDVRESLLIPYPASRNQHPETGLLMDERHG